MASYRRNKSGNWEAFVRRKGYPTRTKTFPTKAEAQDWAQGVEREMRRSQWVDAREAERTTLAECLRRYRRDVTPTKKGAKQEENRINKLLEYEELVAKRMSQVRGADVAAFRDRRLAEGRANQTVRNDLTVISRVFNKARKEWGMETVANPVEIVERPAPPKSRKSRISPEREAQLAAHMTLQMRTIFTIAMDCGMRRGEIVNLLRPNLDFKAKTMLAVDTKNGEEREVPMFANSEAALEAWLAHVDEAGASRMDRRVFDYRPDTVTHAFTRACKSIGLRGIVFHDTRHEATSRLVASGQYGIREVAAITGHKTLNMLMTYSHPKAADLVKRARDQAGDGGDVIGELEELLRRAKGRPV